MNLIIIIITVFFSYFLFFRKIIYLENNPSFLADYSDGVDMIIKRGIFTVSRSSFNNVEEINNKIQPFKIIEFSGLTGKLYKSNYTTRLFIRTTRNSPSIIPYNINGEYQKVTFNNHLKIESKRKREEGLVITKFEYDTNKRLIREFEIIEDKEIEKNTYQYYDKNNIIVHKEFKKGKLYRTKEVELKKSKVSIDERDSKLTNTNNWVKVKIKDEGRKSNSIEYYKNGKIEKSESYIKGKLDYKMIYDPDTETIIKNETYIKGKLYSTMILDPNTGETIKHLIEDVDWSKE
jgi:hypothetical protein